MEGGRGRRIGLGKWDRQEGHYKRFHGQSDKFDICRGEGQEEFLLSCKVEQCAPYSRVTKGKIMTFIPTERFIDKKELVCLYFHILPSKQL